MIGDLLAQISGEAGSKAAPTASLPKRKAVSDLQSDQAPKVPRVTAAAPANVKDRNEVRTHALGTSRTPSLHSRPSVASQSDQRTKPAMTAQNFTSTSAVRRPDAAPSSLSSRPSARLSHPVSSSKADRSSTDASKSTALKSAPRKGSYLEIMERAKAAQSGMGQLGKIQHKPLDKVPSKRDRMATKFEETSRAGATKIRPGLSPQQSIGPRPGMASRPGMGQRPARGGDRNGGTTNGNSLAPAKPGSVAAAPRQRPGMAASRNLKEEEKRPKKAATATTGYQGTARPRPTSSTSTAGTLGGQRRNGLGDDRSGGSKARQHSSVRRMPFSNPRRSRYDEDDEMDDFIEYDDDEEEESTGVGGSRYSSYGRRNRYDDDDGEEENESDMEAGLSDIDDEERLADRAARREDAEQEALERRLKLEKEERKRRLMGSSRR
ncbi:hypothetical protein SEPCBS57363_006715 [Sporothrix epigloea]|uniref:Chromatin spt2 protein n=1 Tax=Sporothrix epigloea TaxID=1892477 RepID=A0ABP0E4G5_9PEZI